MKRTQLLLAAAIIGLGMTIATPWTGHIATAADGEADSVQQFSKASQELYTKVSSSIIHVKVDRNAAALFPEQLQKKFAEWQKQQQGGPGGGGPGGGGPGPKRDIRDKSQGPGGPGGDGPHRPMGGGMGGMGGRFERDGGGDSNEGQWKKFLEEQAQNAGPGPAAAPFRRMAAALDIVNSIPSDIIGIMVDAEGNAIVLGAGLRDAPKDLTLNVTGPDGKETTAKLVGNHLARGIAVIKLESASVATPISLDDARPNSGDLLMCVTGNTGATGWVTVPGRPGKKCEDRFAVYGADERSSNYLFNADGKLTAMGFERFANPWEMLSKDIKWIIEHQADLKPRQLGVKYSRVPMNSPLRASNSTLGAKPAVVIDEVIDGSLAKQAGVEKGDLLVSIDGKPLWQIGQILMDLATRTDKVPVVVIRDNKEVHLELPLNSPPTTQP